METKHALQEIGDGSGFMCTVCGWKWKREPYINGCPGLPRYEWNTSPENLRTTKQLRADHLKPGGAPKGCIKLKDGWCYLYDKAEAVPVRAMSEAQAAALAKARARANLVHCPGCGEDLDRHWFDRRGGLCYACQDRIKARRAAARDKRARDEAITWARAQLAAGCLILDTETTDLDQPEVIEVAVIDSAGAVLFNERIMPVSEIKPGAQRAHGISREMLAGCQAWPAVYPRLVALLAGRVVVTYNAEFDSRAVAYTASLHHLLQFELHWECAMEAYALYAGEWSDHWGSYKWQALYGGDHSALGDCRAALERVRAMAESKLSSEVEDGEHSGE